MLVIELLEHVGLELLVVPNRLQDLLALLVRSGLDQIGDLRRVQPGQPPGASRNREVGTCPTNGSISDHGTNWVWSCS